MKKFILPLVVTLLSQTMTPAMAQTSKQVDLNAVLLSGEEMDIYPAPHSESDWEEARRICDSHVKAYSYSSDKIVVDFDPEFSDRCFWVQDHFYHLANKAAEEKRAADNKVLDTLFRKDAAK